MEENVKQIIVRKDGNKTIQTRKIWQYDRGHELVFEGFDTLPEVFQVHFSHNPAGEAQTQIGQNCVCLVPDIYVEKAAPIYAWIYVAEEDTGLTKQEIEIPVGRKSKPNDQEPEPVEQSAIDQAIAALNAGVERSEAAAEAAEDAQAGAEAAEQGASAAEDSAGASAALAAQKAEMATREADRAEAAEGIVEQAARDAVEDVTEVAEQAASDLGGIVRDAQTQIAGSVQQAQQAAQAASGSATAAAGSAGTAAGSATAADQSAQAAAQKKAEMDTRADEIENELTSLTIALNHVAQEETAQSIEGLVEQITALVRQIVEEGTGGGGDLNGYSLNRGAGNEVILSYTNPEDETETAEAILPTGTTQDEILAEMHTITESLEIWAGGAA